MKQSLQLRIGQSLTMTPQLQQAIRLLQLSTLELQIEIQGALESNPMLEIEDEIDSLDNERNKDNSPTGEQDSFSSAGDTVDGSSTETDYSNNDNQAIPDDLPVDTAWEDIYDMPVSATGSPGDEDRAQDFLENQSGEDDALIAHLLWQLQVTKLSDTDRAIALAVIDAVNDDGYLSETVEQIHAGLVDELEIDLEEVVAMLHLVQHFDPIGVAARDLKECLMLQLDQFDNNAPEVKGARIIVKGFLDLLGNHDYARLKRFTKFNEDELADIIRFIRSLNPKPGATISSKAAPYIVPDVFVRKLNDRWLVELNPDTAPKLRVNPLYASYVNRGDRSTDNTFMKNNLQEARWFIKSLMSRNETLLRVASSIVAHQRTFLEYGDEGMKPLVLRAIAEELELHESTISRVTTQKYMHTPRGVFEFKHFFSSHVGTADGGECSATAIRAMIKKLIDSEDARKPMSDNKIADILVKQGINVARRTVAKYREAMIIAPSNERKRLS